MWAVGFEFADWVHLYKKTYYDKIFTFEEATYITFNQCAAEGGSIRKGEHGAPVVFWKQMRIEDREHPDENGKPTERIIPLLKYYTVFHIDQCDGIKAKFQQAEPERPLNPVAEAEQIVTAYQGREKLHISRTGLSDRAFYSPLRDYVQVPSLDQYAQSAEYYSTLFHELTHSTGHVSRLNRFSRSAASAAFGSEEYSKEELIAEIGAAALVNHCGIETPHSFKNSVAYLQSWARALRNDETMIVAAAGKAEKAVAYILG